MTRFGTLLIAALLVFSVSHAETPEVTASPVETEPKPEKFNWLHAALDSYQAHLNSKSAIGFRPRIGFDLFFPASAIEKHFSVGGALSFYQLPFSELKINRTDISATLGYWILDQRIGFLLHAGETTTTVSDYVEESNHYHYGFEVKYRKRISERFSVFAGAGYTFYQPTHLSRDTHVPVTDSQFTNNVCTLLTFGLANGCGTKRESLDLPRMSAPDLSLGIGFYF